MSLSNRKNKLNCFYHRGTEDTEKAHPSANSRQTQLRESLSFNSFGNGTRIGAN